MPYSFPDKIPQWASKKTPAVQKVAITVFNSTLKDTGDEQKALQAGLAAMKNKEAADAKVNKSREEVKEYTLAVSSSLEGIIKSKYKLE